MHDSPPVPRSEPDLGFDWEAERRWWDATWVTYGFAVLVGFAVMGGSVLYEDAEYALWMAGGLAVVMAVLAPWGLHMRRKLAGEAGTPVRAIPVLLRRLRDGRVPDGSRAREAMVVLGQRYLRGAKYNRWTYPLLVGVLLLNAVTQGIKGHGGPALTWLAGAALLAVAAFFVHRTSSRMARTMSRLEGMSQ